MSKHQNGDSKRKLVLYFDIRNTVLVADSISNITVEQALNSYMTAVTWGKNTPHGWQWCSDKPSLRAPHPDAITYYKHLEQDIVKCATERSALRKATGDFTQTVGTQFEGYFLDGLKNIEWKGEPKNFLTMQSHNKTYHYILPAFFHCMNYLQKAGREYTLIFRTYGIDTENVLRATEQTILGNHPQFDAMDVKINMKPGQLKRVKNGFELYDCNTKNGQRPLTSELEIYKKFTESSGVSGYVDDFTFWQENGYHHESGKPLWIDPNDHSIQQIIFDDNIRVSDVDSIVNLRLLNSRTGKSRSLSQKETEIMEDSCLVQMDLLDGVSNQNYFIDKVKLCETNYDRFLMSLSGE
ncbi:unnamed protein product [Owenia fusiformis]|uniref:Uncharacterized protein n=1 Tax=Owenia fusiformis TaxID=6347 RepID=A0A8J1T664_OWEFU|nr:unnamed protein product [Owenia fusiformis]